MRSMTMCTVTPRRVASAVTRSSWWRALSTSTTQGRRWAGSRCSAWSKAATTTWAAVWWSEPVSHVDRAFDPGRRSAVKMVSPVSGSVMM
ncbi:hypothetical protein [Streptomyces sp. NPDC050388]|uniref:hypothetical protein n=1 Tax=Streptomyces sp. NPDC050388 TaxID=3155781 RepID=UPI0034277F6F